MTLTNDRIDEIATMIEMNYQRTETYESMIEELILGVQERDKMLEDANQQLSEIMVIIQGIKRKISDVHD